jgi:hypothetical protein
MTDTVKGAGRRRAAAKGSKIARNEKRLEEVKAAEKSGKVVRGQAKAPAKKSDARKRAEAMSTAIESRSKKTAPAGGESTWNPDKSYGNNVDDLKNAGVTWRRIAEIATEAGHETPWPDGGRLLRERKRFLAGTEGQPVKRGGAKGPRKARKSAASDGAGEGHTSYAESAEERLAEALGRRRVPWDDESSPEEIIRLLNGRSIEFVSRVSGNTTSARILKDSKHTVIREGQDGPYITFASVDGPFLNISLSRIISVG